MLPVSFFDQPANALAAGLLGRHLCRRIDHPDFGPVHLTVRIVETEAYFAHEKASHSSLGKTPSRQSMFEAPGTIYMYFARGSASLNFSARGDGDAVLIKAGKPVALASEFGRDITLMQQNRASQGLESLCRGQTLLCRALALTVAAWDGRLPDTTAFYVDDGEPAVEILLCRRLGIPEGRDHELPLRFVDAQWAQYATRNPLTARTVASGSDFRRCSVRRAIAQSNVLKPQA